MSNPINLLAERHAHFEAADKLIAAARQRGKDLSATELAEFDKHLAAMRGVEDQLADMSASEAIVALSSRRKGPAPLPLLTGIKPQGSHDDFEAYLRTGIMNTADLSPSADPGGGVLIPTEWYQNVTRRFQGFRPVENVARIIQTDNGDPLVFPRIDDSTAGQYLAASASTGSAAPPTTLDKIVLGAFKASSKPVAVSRELLSDAAYNVGEEIVAMLGARCGRLLNASFTSGNPASEPGGFLTGCTYAEAAGANLTLDDVLGLVYAIAAQHRKPSNVFMMSSVTQKFLRSLKTGITNDQTPLWQESPRAGEPPTLYGAPVIVNDDMPDVGAAGAVVKGCVAYGDFANCFLIRKAGPSYILRYQLPTTDEFAFVVFERADSKLLMPEGIAALDEKA